jgi:glucose-1-phosphate cytidylyltransferase
MKVVILAGGLGTRLQEETLLKPKPMVEIGGQPILWHIMKIFSSYGFNEFIISLGYRADVIKDYFLNYQFRRNDLSIKLRNGEVTVHNKGCEDWTVHLVDTGLHSETGGRIRGLAPLIGNETFMMTYGDGVANIDINALVKFHYDQCKLVTVTAVHPPARFGGISMQEKTVTNFAEKIQVGEGWINGGYFVIEPKALSYIPNDFTPWEGNPMGRIVCDGQLVAYQHEGFWQCMDTPRDMKLLETMWAEGHAPWKVWA